MKVFSFCLVHGCFFESRLGWAGSAQTAHAEVRVGGDTWQSVWSRSGTDSGGQSTFERVSVNLADFEGATIQVRFRYTLQFGNYFNQVLLNPLVGWIIDDIQVGTAYFIQPQVYSMGEPTVWEQYNLEIINRARASASEEAIRLSLTDDPDVVSALAFFNVDLELMIEQFADLSAVSQPLVFNEQLLNAARLHSEDMLANAFQGHFSSANPVPPNQPGDSMADRIQRQNYQIWTAGENVFAYGRSVWHAHAGFNIDWGATASGGSIGGMQDPPGHRESIHNPLFREIGIGIIEGNNGAVGPLVVTQKFATGLGRDHPFLTGVAWRDVNDNGFYDPNEGIAGVLVTVAGERFSAVTSNSGGYAIPLSGNGEFSVTFTHTDGRSYTQTFEVHFSENVKVDFDPIQLASLQPIISIEPNPEVPHRLTVIVSNAEVSTRLQRSNDLLAWFDWLELEPEIAPNGDLHFEIDTPAAGSVFFRAVSGVGD